MDKNIAALLREDTKTVSVRFFKDYNVQDSNKTINLSKNTLLGDDLDYSNKAYIYVTDLDFAVGDFAVVFVGLLLKVVRVVEVHSSVLIEPNDSIEYKWIASKLDLTNYYANQDKNAAITNLVAKSYKQNIRKQFANLLLENMEDSARLQLLETLKGK